MVPRVTLNVGKNSPIAPRSKRSSQRSCRELPSNDSANFSKSSGLNHLRKNLQAEGVSNRATELITNSPCSGSFKHYGLTWGKWVGWCSRREVVDVSH